MNACCKGARCDRETGRSDNGYEEQITLADHILQMEQNFDDSECQRETSHFRYDPRIPN
ncbi:hypothetical protein [Nostoc sp.]|uniref:hypothetical protein n=1 Tax=Nostoc sp. TaxID=1180 RepID=UPI002FF5785E